MPALRSDATTRSVAAATFWSAITATFVAPPGT